MAKLDKQFSELRECYISNVSKDTGRLYKAWEFAQLAHEGQKRLSGEDYVLHSLNVSKTLCSWKLDPDTIVAALLHDTVELGGATEKDLTDQFGEGISSLVTGVNTVTNLRLTGSHKKEFVENLRKTLLVMAKDLRVILIKFADRIHNLETLSALSPDKQKENALETLELYAPLAERMGMGEVKSRLEDLSFPYAYPAEYKKVKTESEKYYKKVGQTIDKLKKGILTSLAKEGVKVAVDGRKKGLYSLWRKLERKGIEWDFDKIHDIVALRVLTNSTADCYLALGVIHKIYKPVPSLGISDYIAQPKPNGYQSIHTKVFAPDGHIAEIQIRTFKMHQEAEYGVAAHWSYSQQKSSGDYSDEELQRNAVKASDSKLSWVKQLVAWQDELKDSEEFLHAVKFDALSHRNFVFSPNGDVYDLPVGATPVDFAYAVHSGLGEYIKGAEVDNKMVPLDYKLQSGEVVEIIKTKQKRKPNRDWLDFVVTEKARREVRKAHNE